VSFGRRLGRFARGFAGSSLGEERLQEALRQSRERGEALRGAFEAAWKGASEEWRTSEEARRAAEEPRPSGTRGYEREYRREAPRTTSTYIPRRYPPEVLEAYRRLELETGASLEEANRRRRELVKRYHPDRFTDPDKRARAERLTAEINAAHDTIERHLVGRSA